VTPPFSGYKADQQHHSNAHEPLSLRRKWLKSIMGSFIFNTLNAVVYRREQEGRDEEREVEV
jgi:hypothetical protein